MLGRDAARRPGRVLLPEGGGGAPELELPDDAAVCSCNNVSAGTICGAVTEDGVHRRRRGQGVHQGRHRLRLVPPAASRSSYDRAGGEGIEVSTALCEHFALSRAQLFDIVASQRVRRSRELVERFGTGRRAGLRHLQADRRVDPGEPRHAHILEGEQATLQDTNDHFLANLQKDGTYSVVPRIAGGEVTPEGLIAIGEVAKDFGLYTKITGGQRIDLFGARVDQLPRIWQRLVDAGFESGHAYGKSLRTVKSCVGSTWCRFGVQDSVALAVVLELRYRGLRSPHKIKLGVSGCARECAEARGKDVGVIATDKGWNVYVGGNGGFTPRHAQLLAEDLDTETLVRTIDRFLLYYVRTADRLQRTAPWIEDVEGGLDGVRGGRHARTRWASRRTSTRRWRSTSSSTRTSGAPRWRTRRSCVGSRRS